MVIWGFIRKIFRTYQIAFYEKDIIINNYYEDKVFMRTEFKYLISAKQSKELRDLLELIAKKDKHSVNGGYEVKSLYFDSLDLASFYEKEEGVFSREKFRVRYLKDTVVLEKKCKAGNIGWKNRYYKGDEPNKVFKDFCLALEGKKIHPIVFITYWRFAYDLGACRVTIDTHLTVSNNGFECEIIPHKAILEIKFINNQIPSLLYEAICRMELKRIAFSKYCNGVTKLYGTDLRIINPESFDINTFN